MKDQENVLVIGCGTMGHSIALGAAWAGLPVCLHGLDTTEIDRALSGIADKLDTMRQGGLIDTPAIASVIKRITTTAALDQAAARASFIIEAIPEDLQMKHQLYTHLEQHCRPDTVIASNTSALMPSRLAEMLAYPDRFIVVHFWNPAHLVPLVEVVGGANTSAGIEQRSIDLLHAMNKKPVLVKKEIRGFIGNRLQFALFREAQYLLEQGVASREDIDAAVTFGIGRRLPVTGPLASADMGGLDVFAAISNYLFGDLCSDAAALPVLTSLVAEKKLGQKSGEGFYSWTSQRSQLMNKQREEELIRFLRQDMEDNNTG